MKISYDRNEDILLLQTSKGKIDYAEESWPFVVHFTDKGKPILIEVLHASKFLATVTEVGLRAKSEKFVSVTP